MLDRQLRLQYGLPVEILGRDTPFGYRRTESNIMEMNFEEFEVLIEAYSRYCLKDPLHNICTFIEGKIGRKFTPEGLRQIFVRRPPKLAALLPEKYKTELYICLMKENLI